MNNLLTPIPGRLFETEISVPQTTFHPFKMAICAQTGQISQKVAAQPPTITLF